MSSSTSGAPGELYRSEFVENDGEAKGGKVITG